MSSASDLTLRKLGRLLYSNKIMQETAFNNGLTRHIKLQGGSASGGTTYTTYHLIKDGIFETTLTEQQNYIDNVPSLFQGTVPGAPTAVSAVEGDTEATISFTPPTNDGGSAIISYTVTSSPDGITATGSASPITVTGLTNGTAYTFTVVATNQVGSSASSSASNSVIPSPAISFRAGSGTWIAPAGVESVQYLLVGGGGGGGGGSGTGAGGGGGGGSVKTGTMTVIPGESYNYTVGGGGAGGSGSSGSSNNGVAGQDTVFDTITAKGGGLGYRNSSKNSSNSFGEGGTGQFEDTPTEGGSGGDVRDGTPGRSEGAGGGGGGAGGAGVTSITSGGDNTRGGAGGSGVTSTLLDGSTRTYGVGGKGADEGTPAFIGTLPGANGTANTGNGGGGGASHWLGNNGASGGNGGSGIIVLYY